VELKEREDPLPTGEDQTVAASAWCPEAKLELALIPLSAAYKPELAAPGLGMLGWLVSNVQSARDIAA
jgi:hypothetical protein